MLPPHRQLSLQEIHDELRLRVEQATAELKASRAEIYRAPISPDNTRTTEAALERHRGKMTALAEAVRALDAFAGKVRPPVPTPIRQS